MTFQDFATASPKEYQAMVSPMLPFLTLQHGFRHDKPAGDAKYYVAIYSRLLCSSAVPAAIISIFVVVFLAFATDVWGTFSILVPSSPPRTPEVGMLVVLHLFLLYLSGAVCGDTPPRATSDTTIMASAARIAAT